MLRTEYVHNVYRIEATRIANQGALMLEAGKPHMSVALWCHAEMKKAYIEAGFSKIKESRRDLARE